MVRLSTVLIALGIVLIVVPSPIPIPLVGTAIGAVTLAGGLLLRLLGL